MTTSQAVAIKAEWRDAPFGFSILAKSFKY